jgi:hypothetical protein
LPEQLEVWHAHFGELASDPTGNSQDLSKWREIAGDARLPALQGLDADFSMADVWKALQGRKTHHAPGGDGIPTDFYQAVLKEKKRLKEWRKEQEANQQATEGGGGINFGSESNRASQMRRGNQPANAGASRAGEWETGSAQASAGRAGAGGARNDGTRDGGARTHGNKDGTHGARNGTARDNSNGDDNAGTGNKDKQEPSLFMTTALLNLLNCAWSTGMVLWMIGLNPLSSPFQKRVT